MNKYREINDYILKIRELEIAGLQEIRDVLINRLDNSYSVSEVIKGLNLDELNVPNRNDYRLYIWITVTRNNKEYWITAMYQDQDFETGNIHHQFGRIQFWKNIKHYSKEWCSTPNTPVGDNYHWIFNYDNSYDPSIKLFDENFSANKVVDKFITFMKGDNMRLVSLTKDYKKQLEDMLEEWTTYNKEHPETNHSPWAIFKNDYHDFDYYLENLELKEAIDDKVPDSTFFLYDEERDIFVGAVNIRHYLNESLLLTGGHIGDGIRPSERRKGYGTLIIKLALKECRKLGIDKVLMTCDKNNSGSKKAIISNGGVLENEVLDGEEICQRYWIENK